MPTNNFLQFATAAGALVEADADYASDAARLLGFQNGVADPAHVNKAWRQGAIGSAIIGQTIVDHAGVDAVDNGDTAGQKAAFRIAIAAMLASSAFGQDTSATPNAIVVALDPAPPNLITPRNLFVRINNTNTGSVTIALNALGTKNATRRDGTPFQPGDLVVGQFAHFIYNATLGIWVLGGFASTEVPRIASAPVLYVRSDGNDANDGSANDAGHAFLTPEAAIKAGITRFSTGGTSLTVQLGMGGTYPAPSAPLFAPASSIIVRGDPANQSAYTIAGTGPNIGGGGSVVGVIAGRFVFSGLTISNTGGSTFNNNTIGGSSGAGITCQNVTFASTGGSFGAHCAAGTASSVLIGTGCIITGNMAYALQATPGGSVILGGPVLTVAGTPTFSQAFVSALGCGVVQVTGGASISGSASGVRYFAGANGVINTSGAGANFFPGSTAGSTSTGGQYV